jgi:hypothetical protein
VFWSKARLRDEACRVREQDMTILLIEHNPAKPNLQGMAVAPLQDSNRANSLAAQLR